MRHQLLLGLAAGITILLRSSVAVGDVPITNGSFEQGDRAPRGWTLNRGEGDWLNEGVDGSRAISVRGDGRTDNAWLSQPLPLRTNTLYRLQFQARRVSGASGSAVTGPLFCNRDVSGLGSDWTELESYFVTPNEADAERFRLRFGQWKVAGEVAFDHVRLQRATAIHHRVGEIYLGSGERIRGGRYIFTAPLGGVSANHARPLEHHQCPFNTNRWVLSSPATTVTYRHRIGPAQQAVRVTAQVGWHQRGELLVEARGSDTASFQELGTLGAVGADTFAVPAELLPADELWIRFSARPKPGEDAPAALQLYGYEYEATLAQPLPDQVGTTRLLAIEREDPQLEVLVTGIGDALPGGRNVVELQLHNRAQKTLALLVQCATSAGATTEHLETLQSIALEAGATSRVVQLPYTLGTGDMHRLRIAISGDAEFSAETAIHVPALHAAHYGETLPGSNEQLQLWWCASGWKVSRRRPPPQRLGQAVIIRAAANETEAAQLVLRPTSPVNNLQVKASELLTDDGRSMPAATVEVRRVGYVLVTQPTDATGTTGMWPDPLPPLSAGSALPADVNFPLWICVHVPKQQSAGVYRGTISLRSDTWRINVPLEVEVFGFELPDRMSCKTAFGLNTSLIWRYHGASNDRQRRDVLAQYLQCLSEHHISPYQPAPLDPIQVTWKNHDTSRDQATDRPPVRDVDAASEEPPIPVPQFDFRQWDEAMTRAIDHWHFNTFRLAIPGLGGGTFHARHEPELLGYGEDTPQYRGAMKAYLQTLQEHLRRKGWLDEAFVYWFDEPDPKDYDFVNNGFAKLRRWAPDIPRMLTEQVEPELVGGPNIWCPVTSSYDHERSAERRRAGDEFWWYVCTGPKAPYCTLFIDHPATELRVWLWQTWQRDIRGILVWQTNYWTSSAAYPDPEQPQNPYADPMGWVSGYSTPAGTRRAWGNGDGRFIYPPESAADGRPATTVLEPPVSSIRLEMLRDGIEDYEYLTMLKELLARHEDRLDAQQRARFERLLAVPEQITADMTTFTTDPGPIEARRRELAGAIATLRQLGL